MVSIVSTSNGKGGTISMNIATAVSSPTITRSLNVEFDAEMPPGYERGLSSAAISGTGPSSLGTGSTQPLAASTTAVTSPTSTHGVSLNTSSSAFTPTSGSKITIISHPNLFKRPLWGQPPNITHRWIVFRSRCYIQRP
ncbi:hypothetical protein Hanom_Chr16g01497591 [Helianthus anomalus]